MRYEFVLEEIAATIGFCVCKPEEEMPLAEAAAYLKAHPMDEFMHRYILRALGEMEPVNGEEIARLAEDNPAFASCVVEAAETRSELAAVVTGISNLDEHSPLIDLRYASRSNHELMLEWSNIFAANLGELEALPGKGEAPQYPYDDEIVENALASFAHVEDVASRIKIPGKKEKPVSVQETSRKAEQALTKAGVRMSNQMRHQQSLAPVGLVRQWKNDMPVSLDGVDYTVFGTHTSFGRGLEFDPSQAALLMEMVERYSSWAKVQDGGVAGYKSSHKLLKSRYSEFGKAQAIDPNSFPLEASYNDEAIYWVNCQTYRGKDIFVPAQMIWLFMNLDEPAFYSGLGSTGLASGNIMEQAKVGGLLEVMERDAECVAPFDYSQCFRIESSDKSVTELLASYASKNIDVMFQDITPEHGVPCYRAFAVGSEGQVVKGASCKLSGPRAIISAMLEVPYPYPFGMASKQGPKDLPVRKVEDLPDYSTGKFSGDLKLLETLLVESGRDPVYANLTRADFGIPVCRALVPSMELLADFDKYSTISPRMFANYNKLV